MRLVGVARRAPAPGPAAAPPGFATRVAAAWEETRTTEVSLQTLWFRLALGFAVPSMALALLALGFALPTDLPLDDPAFAAVDSFNRLALDL
jgi:hypothetical protein